MKFLQIKTVEKIQTTILALRTILALTKLNMLRSNMLSLIDYLRKLVEFKELQWRIVN